MGGYKIKLVGVPIPSTLDFDSREEGMKRYGGWNGLILSVLFSKINATLSARLLEKGTKFHPLLKNVTAGEYDMLMNAQYIFDKQDYKMSYPHMESGISMLSR